MEAAAVSLLSIKSSDEDLLAKSKEAAAALVVEPPVAVTSTLSDNDEIGSPHPTSSRSSKRANSSTSVSERSKFRSKLDCFPVYPATSVSSAKEETVKLFISDATSIKSISSTRHDSHDSNSSVLDNQTAAHSKTPLDLVLNNKELSPLFRIKLINQLELSKLINWHYSQKLPDCELVFPWLHGIHHSNQNQREFLSSLTNYTSINKNNFDFFQNSSKIPSSYRGFMPIRSTIGKTAATIKGSVTAEEILCPLDISRQDLLIMLNNMLKGIKIDETHSKEEFEEILSKLHKDCIRTSLLPLFKNLDPQRGISLRNFHIQVSKMSQISDFVVYCFNNDHLDSEGSCSCESIAILLYFAQIKHSIDHPELVDSLFSTFILKANDLKFYRKHPKLLSFDKYSELQQEHKSARLSARNTENWDSNYLLREKFEISKMSSATPLTENVWCGNAADFEVLKLHGFDPKHTYKKSDLPAYVDPKNSTVTNPMEELQDDETYLLSPAKADWKLFINCCESSSFPDPNTLSYLLHKNGLDKDVHLTFLPSGSIGIGDCTDTDLVSFVNTCKVLYIKSSKEIPSLIYCADGYTESTLLAVAYLIYATGKRLAEVVLELHKTLGRPFFLFPTDVQLLSRLEAILIHYSPVTLGDKFDPRELEILNDTIVYNHLFLPKPGTWFTSISGSMPSRILPHLYLGSLNHANSSELLSNLGIKRIVSVGEILDCIEDQKLLRVKTINNNISIFTDFDSSNPINQLMSITNIQDDGIDMLTHSLPDILNFIDEGYKSGENVLVHCRVGVSRSATVCIAEVMKRLNINLIRAYLYVRVRRLNIIIQPNLRFMYELFKWEEAERIKSMKRIERESSSENSIISEISSGNISKVSSVEQLRIPSITVNEGITDSEVSDDEEDLAPALQERWLRDVDWHVLCREIDQLNKAYIRS